MSIATIIACVSTSALVAVLVMTWQAVDKNLDKDVVRLSNDEEAKRAVELLHRKEYDVYTIHRVYKQLNKY